jgi:hypothetical protein
MKAIRIALLVCAAAFVSPVAQPASAETITFSIGEFLWDDPFGFGPELQILNFASSPQFSSGEIPSTFSGGSFADVVLTTVLAADASPATTEVGELTAGSTFLGLFDPLASASLSFTFLYALADATLSQTYSLTLLQPELDVSGGRHASQLINFSLATEPTPVPEPGSLLLVSVGLLVAAARRRRTSRGRT